MQIIPVHMVHTNNISVANCSVLSKVFFLNLRPACKKHTYHCRLVCYLLCKFDLCVCYKRYDRCMGTIIIINTLVSLKVF